jgi:hypothetical protein
MDEWIKKQSNTLEFYKFDIGSVINILWVGLATLLGISLVLSHRPHLDVPQAATDKKC